MIASVISTRLEAYRTSTGVLDVSAGTGVRFAAADVARALDWEGEELGDFGVQVWAEPEFPVIEVQIGEENPLWLTLEQPTGDGGWRIAAMHLDRPPKWAAPETDFHPGS